MNMKLQSESQKERDLPLGTPSRKLKDTIKRDVRETL